MQRGKQRGHPSGRKTTYGKVAEAAAKLEAPKDIKLKDPKDWKIAGKGLKRLDTADKLTGKQVYGIDIKMPGMLVAAIKDSPVRTGKIKSFDAAKVAGMPGVKKVVQVGDSGVAVIADSYWRAHKAIEALPIVWDPGEAGKVSSASIAEFLKGGLDAEQAFVGNKAGDAKAALAGAARKIEAVYSYPYQNHATMEPMNMTALYTADKCEVWGPTQNGEAALAAVSEESGLPIGKCDVHKFLCGGGFGRRGRVDYVRQAVAIAKQMPGTPIKLIWSREEDMTHCGYHPVTPAKLTAGVAGFWRGVDVNHNAIYTECFIDEVADALGQDKLAFRLKFLKPKHAAVLKAVADKVGWSTPAPQGVYRGLSQYMAHASYVAAIDPGYAVNPAQIERQVAGSFVFGLSALLYGECTVKDGAIEQTNFDTYNSLRIREMPKVEVIVMPSGGFWGGVGEPTVSVAAPAVLNAIFAATGKRLRSIPLMHEGIRTA